MKHNCDVPDLHSRVILCKHGCAHVQMGPAIVIMSLSSLRGLIVTATDALQAHDGLEAGVALAEAVN